MNLFEKKNKVELLDSFIRTLTRENDYRLISDNKKWTIFEKDEQLVQMIINKGNNSEEVELCVTLFDDIGVGMEVFIRNILVDRTIRQMSKRDQFRKRNCKVEMFRILKLKNSSLNKANISRQIKMFTNQARRIKKVADELLDYTLFIKLN